MRVFGRDPIRGGHYGQRSCEPHQKAEHMAAPTKPAKREKSSCQPGAVHTWHEPDQPRCPQFGRFRGESGRRPNSPIWSRMPEAEVGPSPTVARYALMLRAEIT